MKLNTKDDHVVLNVKGLKTYFFTSEGVIKAVDGVDFKINEGEVMGIVGESGCGKSVTAYSILRLVQSPPGRIVGGEILFGDKDLLKLSKEEIRKVRGKIISMVFQDPLTSLNPVLKIGYQISEIFRYHKGMNKVLSLKESIRMLSETEIPSSEDRIKSYPYELSGGMRQRAMISMALACEPKLMIADEPTSALDVTVQAGILKIMKRICKELGTSLLIITHDMGVVAKMCNKVMVMYAGKIVEKADVISLFTKTAHPYTAGLLASLPRLGSKKDRLISIPGMPPPLSHLPLGCSYEPRCQYKSGKCKEELPEINYVDNGHEVRCHYPLKGVK